MGNPTFTWWGLWQWYGLWPIRFIYETYMHLPGFNDWDLPQPHGLEGEKGPTSPSILRWPRDELPLCQAVCQWLTFRKTPHQKWTLMMMMKKRISYSCTWWPSMVWRAYTQQATTVHPPDTTQINKWPYSQTSIPISTTHSRRCTPRSRTNGCFNTDGLLDVINAPDQELY